MQVFPRYSSYSYVIESDYITKVKHISLVCEICRTTVQYLISHDLENEKHKP